ncbi:MAG: ABC transporter permease [Dehalococcoidia bacterium]|nr:ABC transporter permease [Dehalococcoidia bacterium]
MPGLLHYCRARASVEIRQFFRTGDAVFFSFLLPVLFVFIFATVFSGDIEGPPGTEPVPFSQYFVAGIIAAGVMSTTFASLAISISIEQHNGALKRLQGTPLPRTAYFAGKLALAIVTSFAQTAIILAIGMTFYGMSLAQQTRPSRGRFALVFIFGVSSSSLLGIAYTALIRSATSGATVVQPPFLILQFISGVFFVYSDVPRFLQVVASVFPLKWMVQGFRQVFLPDWVAVDDYGGSWNTEWVLVVLIGWAIASFLIARYTFRWDRSS